MEEEIEFLKKEMAEKEKEYKLLDKKLSKQFREFSNARATYEKTNDFDKYKDEVDETRKKNENLMKTMSEMQDEIKKIRSNINDIERKIRNLEYN